MRMHRASRIAWVALAGFVMVAAEAPPPERPPALAALADSIVDHLAEAFPVRTGRIVRIAPTRALALVSGVGVGDVLEVYAPEAEPGSTSEDRPQSLYLLGKAKVAEVTSEGAMLEPLPPLLLEHLSEGLHVKSRRGPRRVALSAGSAEGALEPLAAALYAILPDRLRARGFLPVDADLIPRGSLLSEGPAAERALEASGADHLLHLIVESRTGAIGAIAELLTAGPPRSWDVFSAQAPSDAEVALLLGPPRSASPGLRVAAAVPLPDRPLALQAGAGELWVLMPKAISRYRVREGALSEAVTIDIPASLPTLPARSLAGFLAVADLDADGRQEAYVLGNWLRYPYRVTPIGGTGTFESMAEGIACVTAGGGYLTGSFLPGTDLLSGDVAFHPAGAAPATGLRLPFNLLRAVPWERDHCLLLAQDGELYVLRPEGSEVTPLSPPRRTGYAFDVAYDAGGGRTVLGMSSLDASKDQVRLEPLLPPEQGLGRVDLPSVVEALALRDVDQDGRIELLLAEARGAGGEGTERLSLYATDLVAAAPAPPRAPLASHP